jgi:hypothetical protein
MSSNSGLGSLPVQLGIGAIIIMVVFLAYTNGFSRITNPTAQQSLDNKSFMLFFVYIAVCLAVIIYSIQSKSMPVFFGVLAVMSFLFFILSGSWQYVPV